VINKSLSPWLNTDGTYLITGGTRGFGLALAEWLVERGARSLVLVSRSGVREEAAILAVQRMEAAGAVVRGEAIDICDQEAVETLIGELDTEERPLRGIFHGAMVLEDQFLKDIQWSNLVKVLEPKISGAWNLHRATRALSHGALETFVMFSSISSLIGNEWQGAYVVANSFLDSLAHHRKAAGLPALTINWGVFGETGVVARQENLASTLGRVGILGMSTADALTALNQALEMDAPQLGVFDVNWQDLVAKRPGIFRSSRFKSVIEGATGGEPGDSPLDDLLGSLESMEPAERYKEVERILLEALAAIMKCPVEKLESAVSLKDLGVDSLMGFELSSRVQEEHGILLSNKDLGDGSSVAVLAEALLRKYFPA
jgi:NAD(P)-dependent dehydrogenase (short-subunit alcohol dehydrogenase family)/acyl carrier protein